MNYDIVIPRSLSCIFQYTYSSPFSSVSSCEIFKSKTLIDICGSLGELAVAGRLTALWSDAMKITFLEGNMHLIFPLPIFQSFKWSFLLYSLYTKPLYKESWANGGADQPVKGGPCRTLSRYSVSFIAVVFFASKWIHVHRTLLWQIHLPTVPLGKK
jgi:hypothetical protein